MTLSLVGGQVLTSLDPVAVVPADVVVAAGRVALVGSAPAGGRRIDCGGCLVVPGNVCAHTHLYATLARGMPAHPEPPQSFLQLLQRLWWRLDRGLDPASVRAAALAGGLEALLAGTTALVDHHASPRAADGSLDLVADALGQLGLRSVLCYEVSDRDGPTAAAAGLVENRRFAGRVAAGALPLARAMVGAHASFTLSQETLASCVETARAAGVGIHLHLAEDGTDRADALARHGTGAVERLAAAGAIGAETVLAHGVRLDDGEVEAVNALRPLVVHNCRSNASNAVGRAPVARLRRLALGTDGIDGDMFAEARAALLGRREESLLTDPAWALARLAEGARFVGAAFGEPQLGRLAPGAPADLAVLAYDPPTPLTAASLLGHVAFGLHAGLVRDVLVAGEAVVRDRRPTRVDAAELLADARVQAAALWRRVEAIGPHPFAPAGLAA